MIVNDYLLDQFAHEFVSRDNGESFLALLDEWQSKVAERMFSMSIVDVTVNFVEGWAEIVDVLEVDRSHRVTLAELRAVARSARS